MAVEVAFDIEEGARPLAVSADELDGLCEAVLASQGVVRPCVVSVTVATDEGIRRLNLEWRGQDRPTDVVSLECERPDDPDLPDGVPCELGDIVLAPRVIERQAERFGTTPADETRLLVVHGMLHLLGYDHLDDAEAEVMEALEDRLLAELTDGRIGAVATTRHEELRAGGDAL